MLLGSQSMVLRMTARHTPRYEFGLSEGDLPILSEAIALAELTRLRGIVEARQELEAGAPMAAETKAIRQQQLRGVRDVKRRLNNIDGNQVKLTAGGVLLTIDVVREAEQAVLYDQICLENEAKAGVAVSNEKRNHLADKRQRLEAMGIRLAKQAAKRRWKFVRWNGRKSK